MSVSPPSVDEHLIGNQTQRQQLYDLAKSSHLHHCLLFDGPTGLGKSLAARWLAKAINCEKNQGHPCNTCWSCKSINSGEHPDVIELGLDPEKTTPVISVKQARSLISRLATHNFRAKMRFVIIDPADAMRTEASNALLKTLEDPPSDTIFILISAHCDNLISTIKSRSQTIRFHRLTEQEMQQFYAGFSKEYYQLGIALSDNRPGLAVSLAEGNLQHWAALRGELIQALNTSAESLLKFSAALTKGDKKDSSRRIQTLLGILESLLRDTLLSHHKVTQVKYMNADIPKTIEHWVSQISVEDISKLMDDMSVFRQDLQKHVNNRLLIDQLLLSIYTQLKS